MYGGMGSGMYGGMGSSMYGGTGYGGMGSGMYGGMGSGLYGGTGYGGMGSSMYGGTGYSGIGMNNGIDMLNNNNMINGIGQQHNSNGSHLQTRNIQGVTSGHRNQPLQSDRGVNAQQNGVNGGDQFNNHNGQSNDSNDRPKPTQVDIEQLRQQRDYSKKQKRFFLLQATTQLLSQVVMCIVQGLRGVQEVVMLSFGAYYSANMVRDFVDAYKRQQKRNIAPQGRDQGGQYDGQRHYSQLQQQGVTGKSSSPLLFKIKTVLLAAAMYTILNGGMSLCFRMMHNDKWKRSLSEQKKQWLPKLLGVLGIPLIGNAGSSVHPLIANWLGVGMRRDEEVNDIVHRNEAIDTDASMCEDISSRECIHVVQSGNREDDEGNIRLSGASDAATTDGDSEGDTEFEQYFRQIQENEEKENLYRIHNSQSNNATVPLSYHDYGGLAPVHQGNFAPSNRGSGLIYVAQFDYRSSGKNGDTTDFKAGDQFIIEDYSEATWCDAVPHKRAQTGELIIDDQCGRISIPVQMPAVVYSWMGVTHGEYAIVPEGLLRPDDEDVDNGRKPLLRDQARRNRREVADDAHRLLNGLHDIDEESESLPPTPLPIEDEAVDIHLLHLQEQNDLIEEENFTRMTALNDQEKAWKELYNKQLSEKSRLQVKPPPVINKVEEKEKSSKCCC